MFSDCKEAENEEEDIFSFVYTKSKSLNKTLTDTAENKQDQNEILDLRSSENSKDFLKKNAKIVEDSSKKKEKKKITIKSQNKKQKKKSENKNTYKTNIFDEEAEYLFNFLKDASKQKITEATLRKALSTAGMTDIDDDFLKVRKNLFLVNIFLENDFNF